MNIKNKRILATVILILGIIIISSSIILFLLNDNKNENNNTNQESEIKLNIFNFQVDTNTTNVVKIIFDLRNEGEKAILNQDLALNFYYNDDIVYVYEYKISELAPLDETTIETNLSFEYEKITKYEFVVDNLKQEIVPFSITS